LKKWVKRLKAENTKNTFRFPTGPIEYFIHINFSIPDSNLGKKIFEKKNFTFFTLIGNFYFSLYAEQILIAWCQLKNL